LKYGPIIKSPFLIPWLIASLVPALSVAEDPPARRTLNIGSEKQLLIDDLFFDQSENIRLRLHPAQKSGEHNVVRDRPWESATLNWFSFLEDDGVYRMWYECYDVEGWPTINDTSFCYCESKDGIHWMKPELGLFEYQGSKANNVLFRQIGPEGAHSRVHGTCVFIDPVARPESRYKAISQGMFPTPPDYRIAGMHSSDGLKWTRYPKPICNLFADSQFSGFWDDGTEKYTIYGRVSHRGRALGRAEGDDFEHFSDLSLVLAPNDNDPPESDLYNSAATKYRYCADIYFMFPSLFQHSTQTLDIRLAVSRDGISWTYPDQETPFIALGKKGEFDSGSLYMGQGIIRRDNELYLYYGGSRLNHAEGELENLTKPDGSRIYSRVTVPLDRFVSAEADANGGFFITPPMIFAGNTLHLNAEIHEGGSAKVAVLDVDGQPFKNRSVKECLPIAGRKNVKQVFWKADGDVSAFAGTPVRLRIELNNANLYSLEFKQGYPYRVK
jgi:hypothetical protein